MTQEAVQGNSSGTIVTLIFAVPDVDGEHLLFKILSKLLMLTWITSREWIDFEGQREAAVENLLDGWLACVEQTKLVLLDEIIRLCKLDLGCRDVCLFNILAGHELDWVSLDNLISVEFECEI